MKKLVKFTTREVVKEVEAEIELPAYFCRGEFLPSKNTDGGYFCPVVKITDGEKVGRMISSDGDQRGVCYGPCFSSNLEVINSWTQVPESEWLAAVALLKSDINGKETEGE